MIGQKLGHFTITRQIAEGGMGAVYLALDHSLNRQVALKVIRPSILDEISKRRFVSEARLAAAVQHPYVCRIHEVGEQDGNNYICMEFIEGRSLSEELRRQGTLDFADTVRLGSEICEALISVHALGLIHRDLKPSNIMLASDGHIRVLDFGIAKIVAPAHEETPIQLTLPGAVIGSVGYMSPEQLQDRSVDARSDIFSLGIVLYEMASGTHPFRKSAALETALAVLNDRPLPLSQIRPGIPEWFECVVDRMLAKNPGERYESTQSVLSDLRSSPAVPPVSTSTSSQVPFIAVLPFRNPGNDPEQEYFSEGITDDISSKLCNLTVVRVIGRTSGHRYSIQEHGAARIGAELKVTHILDGSVRRARDLVRINVALTEVRSLRQIWGETYDGNIGDVFTIQSEVAGKVSAALQQTFSAPAREPAPTPSSERIDMDTYELYLKGRFFQNRPMPTNIEKAVRCFELVVEAKPRYARAWAGLSACHAAAAHYGYTEPAAAYPKARMAALRAIELDNQLAEARSWLAFVKGYYDWDWNGAEAEFERALRLDSNSVETLIHYSRFLCVRRKADHAITLITRAVELDPLAPLVNTMAGWVNAMASRFDAAMPYFKRALEIDPAFAMAHTCRAFAFGGMGKYAECIEETRRWSWTPAFLGIAFGYAGRLQEARAIAEQLSAPDARPAHPSEIALIWLCTGEREKARQSLDRAIAERDYMLGLLTCPAWDPWRSDPLIVDTLRRMGLDFGNQTVEAVASSATG